MRKLIYIGFIILLGACESFEPTETPSENQPVFSASGTIDGELIQVSANGDDYFAEASLTTDSLDVNRYHGKLIESNCLRCAPVFEAQFRGLASTSGTDAILNQNEIDIRYVNALDSQLTYEITLNALPLSATSAITWLANGSAFSEEQITFSVPYDENVTVIPFSCTVDYQSGCSNTELDTIYLPHHSCDGILSSVDLGNGVVAYSVENLYADALEYLWVFSDSSTAITQNVQYFYGSTAPDAEDLRLTLKTKNGSATKRWYHDLGNASCVSNTSYSINEVFEYSALAANADHGTFTLLYNSGNTVYSSEHVKQPDWASLEINSVERFSEYNNESVEYNKVTFTFSGLLGNGNQTIEVRDLALTLPFEI